MEHEQYHFLARMKPVASVTVVIPCFRCKKTILRAVKSIENQSTLPERIILIDDCSEDGTLPLLEQISESYANNWITVLSLKCNRGAGEARNAGWDIATTKFVAFLDADDSWHPSKIEIQYTWMLKNPDFFVSGHPCGISATPDSSAPIGHSKSLTATELLTPNCLFFNKLPTPSVMLRTDTDLRFPPRKRYSEDYYLWLKLILTNHKAAILNFQLAELHKPAFGSSGLSGNLTKLEIGELSTYVALFREKNISGLMLLATVSFSLIKYFRRCILSAPRKLLRKS